MMNRRLFILSFMMLVTLSLSATGVVLAQGTRSGKRSKTTTRSEQETARAERQVARDELVKAAKEYKTSLEQLLAFYEKDVGRAAEKRDKLKTLYAEGLVSRRDLEESEEAIAEAQRKVEKVRQDMRSADKMVAEALVEVEIAPPVTAQAGKPTGKLTSTTAYIRYGGALSQWSLSDAWKIQSFFKQRFGVALPVSTFGQSSLHDRWGLDHRNAMDVGVNPDSIQGQELMAYLRANGIPFTAFRVAIQGSSTGPHIHIGFPSRRSFSFVPSR